MTTKCPIFSCILTKYLAVLKVQLMEWWTKTFSYRLTSAGLPQATGLWTADAFSETVT